MASILAESQIMVNIKVLKFLVNISSANEAPAPQNDTSKKTNEVRHKPAVFGELLAWKA